MPLPVFDSNRGNQLQALRLADRAEDELQAVRIQLQAQVFEAREQLQASSQQARLLAGEVLPTARTAYELAARGFALGMVQPLPERDTYSYHRDKMHADIAVAFGGRVAEELVFGYDKVSSGASNDIMQASRLARAMVTKWGLSDELGPLDFSESEDSFTGYSVQRSKPMSDETARMIDSEVKRFVEQGLARARQLLMTAEKMDRQSDVMLEQIRSYNAQLDAVKKDVDELKRQGAAAPAPPSAAPREESKTAPASDKVPPLIAPDVKRGELPKEGNPGGIQSR